MQAMIFSAGLGTRFKPWTDKHPKALGIVNGKSLLQRNIEYLQQYGIKDVIVNVHHFAEQVEDAIVENDGWGSDLLVSDERDELLDTGGGLLKAKELHIYIVLKGAHTIIATPDGITYFNNTGNAGMAKGGSGDVLTGLLTGLLAQGYSPLHTCLLGVYLHGLAGDLAAEAHTQYAMTAMDIVDNLGKGWNQLISG